MAWRALIGRRALLLAGARAWAARSEWRTRVLPQNPDQRSGGQAGRRHGPRLQVRGIEHSAVHAQLRGRWDHRGGDCQQLLAGQQRRNGLPVAAEWRRRERSAFASQRRRGQRLESKARASAGRHRRNQRRVGFAPDAGLEWARGAAQPPAAPAAMPAERSAPPGRPSRAAAAAARHQPRGCGALSAEGMQPLPLLLATALRRRLRTPRRSQPRRERQRPGAAWRRRLASWKRRRRARRNGRRRPRGRKFYGEASPAAARRPSERLRRRRRRRRAGACGLRLRLDSQLLRPLASAAGCVGINAQLIKRRQRWRDA